MKKQQSRSRMLKRQFGIQSGLEPLYSLARQRKKMNLRTMSPKEAVKEARKYDEKNSYVVTPEMIRKREEEDKRKEEETKKKYTGEEIEEHKREVEKKYEQKEDS